MSFCNLSAPGSALGVYNFQTGELGWIPPPDGSAPWIGVDGLCRRDDGHWFLPQMARNGVSGLARLDRQLQISFHAPLRLTADAHSLIPFKGGFLVTDTQHNRLVFTQPDAAGRQVVEEVYWAYRDHDEDVAHLNSVAMLGDEIFVTVFGPKPAAGWAGAQDGQIVHVPSGTVVCRGIAQPHTLTAYGDSLYWLESAKGVVHRLRPSDRQRESIELGGFLRGMAFVGDQIYVAVSALRRNSRSTGVPNAAVARSSREAHSWICRVNLDGTDLRYRRVTEFGTEIYDLAGIEPDAAQPFLEQRAELAAVERIWSYDDEVANLNTRIQGLLRQLNDGRTPKPDRLRRTSRRGWFGAQDAGLLARRAWRYVARFF